MSRKPVSCPRCKERIAYFSAVHDRDGKRIALDSPRCPNAVEHREEDTRDLIRRINAGAQKPLILGTMTAEEYANPHGFWHG